MLIEFCKNYQVRIGSEFSVSLCACIINNILKCLNFGNGCNFRMLDFEGHSNEQPGEYKYL